MAKILLCFSSHIYVDGDFKLLSYYEGLINELNKNNNELLVCNTAEFLEKSWNSSNKESNIIKRNELILAVKNFSPDLVISFNNSKLSFIEDVCDCPIVIWQADSFTYYNDKDEIKRNPDRYLYFCLGMDSFQQLKDIGINENNIHVVQSGTAVQSENLESKFNVSFIGSNFRGPSSLKKLLMENTSDEIKSAIKYLADNFYEDPKQYLQKNNLSFILDVMKPDEFGAINSCQNRINVLNIMSELGLELFGSSSWFDAAEFSPNLALAFNPKPVYTLKHNQDVYNSSRICLNVSHAQAVEAFPWRIMDIMASNGCLLSSYNLGIKKFSEDFVDLPMYKSSGEAYQLARKLLKDDVYRRELVEMSQACIEHKGRWIHRFKEISEITNISLINEAVSTDNQIFYLNRGDYINDFYRLFTRCVMLAAKMTPQRSHAVLYNIATNLGFKIDYHLVKSVMEKNNA